MNAPQKNLLSFLAAALLIFSSIENTQANSATWRSNPESGDWLHSNNWSTGGPPNGSAESATFGASSVTAVNIGVHDVVEVSQVTFDLGASAYTITGPLTIGGTGIVNNSGIVQRFVKTNIVNDTSRITFTNTASAGNLTAFEGRILFRDTSTAANAVFTNYATDFVDFTEFSSAGNAIITNSATAGGGQGVTAFDDSSTASNAMIVNNGALGSFSISPGQTGFADTSTAGHATIICNGATVSDGLGGSVEFQHSSTAGAATIIANGGSAGGKGGTIFFDNSSTGGTSRIEVFGNGNLDLSIHSLTSGVTIGSLEGTGDVFLGSNKLSVGSNNASTIFSGVLQDGGLFGGQVGGSLAKIGTGTLTLSGANIYTGSTTVESGKLIVNGFITSAVTVNGGSLGGSGTTEAVTVNNSGVLSPGTSPGILNVNGDLRLALGSTYLVDLNGNAVGKEYDQTDVTGAVTLEGATLSLNLGFTPVPGSEFTTINNDLSDMIIGTFDGLSEGAMFVSGGHAFTISYHGGDGNDVALTAAVPEPQAWILSLIGVAALIIARRSNRPWIF